jgi:hypothetical protein
VDYPIRNSTHYLLAKLAVHYSRKDIGKGTVPIANGSFTLAMGCVGRRPPMATHSGISMLTKTGERRAIRRRAVFAWYRGYVNITSSGAADRKLAILMPAVVDEYDLYWNGVTNRPSGDSALACRLVYSASSVFGVSGFSYGCDGRGKGCESLVANSSGRADKEIAPRYHFC